jgi:hypothetical protein
MTSHEVGREGYYRCYKDYEMESIAYSLVGREECVATQGSWPPVDWWPAHPTSGPMQSIRGSRIVGYEFGIGKFMV